MTYTTKTYEPLKDSGFVVIINLTNQPSVMKKANLMKIKDAKLQI